MYGSAEQNFAATYERTARPTLPLFCEEILVTKSPSLDQHSLFATKRFWFLKSFQKLSEISEPSKFMMGY